MSVQQISGYASFFNVADLSGDRVAPGAFSKCLERKKAADIKLLYQHDPERPIGRWLSLEEDGLGLFVRGEINEAVQLGRECAALLGQGALDGLSIGFNIVRAEKGASGRGRRLTEIDLWEVSLVTFPMLPAARAYLAPPATETEQAVRQIRKCTEIMLG